MPSWTPNREDVRFDAGLAAKAATECDEVAARLGTQASAMAAPADAARADWTGRTRTDFDAGMDRLASERSTTGAALTALAERIRAAAAAARAEQDHRVAERARWQRELEAEQAANPPCQPHRPC
ncbi:hypothetical protein KSP35_10435 [Aquihabitans sp. G128]|uniref:hypothetical protein n=1 Tax=Aquihabitans sp. G128 TaxID=2849779 RepID=UPI001C218813|nr:hypothetical protein [Aquihabitans sp. G128]QXC63157.1 hypothetical protein KSP35_10435 [Aquihabitans sp. G128]